MLLNLDSPDGSGRSWVDWRLDWVPGRDCWASGHWDPVKMINIFKHIYFFNVQKWMTHLSGRRMDRDPQENFYLMSSLIFSHSLSLNILFL